MYIKRGSVDMNNLFNNNFWATVFTLGGTIIGAGILALPYVISQSGFFIGAFWILFLGIILGYVLLCLGEVSLRTRKTMQLFGFAEKYLGDYAKYLMFIAIVLGIYTALLAYLIGEGQSLSVIFTGNTNYSLYFAIGFWIIMTSLLREGLKGLRKVETWGVLAILVIIVVIVINYFPDVSYENLSYLQFPNFFVPFGVVFFALMGFNCIPELEILIKDKKRFKKAIIMGITIPVVVYILFSFIFVGVFGKNVQEIATLSSGKLVILLGIFTMMTSYFVLSLSLKDFFKYDLKVSKSLNYFLVSILPILIYLFLYFINKLNFVEVIGIGGVISGGLTAILILLMLKSSKHKGDRKPEYSVEINWFIILLLSLIFILGTFFELVG